MARKPNDKYDFYDNNEALEVNVLLVPIEFIINHDQLLSEIDKHYIASIMASENTIDGLSVIDLFENIKKITS